MEEIKKIKVIGFLITFVVFRVMIRLVKAFPNWNWDRIVYVGMCMVLVLILWMATCLAIWGIILSYVFVLKRIIKKDAVTMANVFVKIVSRWYVILGGATLITVLLVSDKLFFSGNIFEKSQLPILIFMIVGFVGSIIWIASSEDDSEWDDSEWNDIWIALSKDDSEWDDSEREDPEGKAKVINFRGDEKSGWNG